MGRMGAVVAGEPLLCGSLRINTGWSIGALPKIRVPAR
jgi:hypothetical protein